MDLNPLKEDFTSDPQHYIQVIQGYLKIYVCSTF